jgi:hypothetical protein
MINPSEGLQHRGPVLACGSYGDFGDRERRRVESS